MRKLKFLIIFALMVTFLIPSIPCYAGTWNNLYVAKYPSYVTTRSYTTSMFKSDGDIGLNLSIYSTSSQNWSSVKVERQTTSGSWETVQTYNKILRVGTYTTFCEIVYAPRGFYYRVVFTSDYNARISGDISYFSS